MKGHLRSAVRSLRNNEFVWRYGLNFTPSLEFALESRNSFNRTEKLMIDTLNRDGIAVTTINDLFGESLELDRLSIAAERMLESRRDEVQALGESAADTSRIGDKTFNLELLGSELTFDPSDVFARFAVSSAILNIANAYLGMHAQLRYFNVWYTFATHAAARESQLWHFDREDNYILKVFVYLKDVGAGAGPFTYAPGTHRKGPHWNRRPESFIEKNVLRSTDDQMDLVIPRDKWVSGIGKKGTVIFADTRGYHKGGEARRENRLMFTCMFTSPASDSKRLLRYPSSSILQQLDKKQRLALKARD